MTPLDAPVNHCMSAIEEHGGVHTSGGDFDGFEGLLADGVSDLTLTLTLTLRRYFWR